LNFSFIVMKNTIEECFLEVGFIQFGLNLISIFTSCGSDLCSFPVQSVLFGSLLEVAKLGFTWGDLLTGCGIVTVTFRQGSKHSSCVCKVILKYSNILCNVGVVVIFQIVDVGLLFTSSTLDWL
jgi:hypothetical protein